MLKILKILWIVELVAMLLNTLISPGFLGFECIDTCPPPKEMTRDLFDVMALNPITIGILGIGVLLWVATLFRLKSISSRERRIAIVASLPIIAAIVVGLAALDIHQMGLPLREEQIDSWISAMFLLYLVASLWPVVMVGAIPFSHGDGPETPLE